MPESKILLLTNVERGQSNIFLAATRALLDANPALELHFASFRGLEADIVSIWEDLRQANPDTSIKPISYQTIKSYSMEQGVQEKFGCTAADARSFLGLQSATSLSFSNSRKSTHKIASIFIPYNGPRTVEVYTSIVNIIKEVTPDLVVVDSLLTPGLTACWNMRIKYIVLSPNSFRDFAGPLQPHAASLWKYPAPMSGYPFPLPWHLVPANVFLSLYAIYATLCDPDSRKVAKYFEDITGVQLRTCLDLYHKRPNTLEILLASHPELDFPLYTIPPHLLACGPIVQFGAPVSEAAPELTSWLTKGPTVYINLGSHYKFSEAAAVEIAIAVKAAFDALETQTTDKHQLIWKLRKLGEYGTTEVGSEIYKILGREINSDRIRITSWVDVNPMSLLDSGHICCAVHHGGANSFNEAVLAGVPHIVLPQWVDCFDYAYRVEWLGIGRHGARKHKPLWEAQELAAELLYVLAGESSRKIKQRANELAVMCRERGDGKAIAAKLILQKLSGPESRATESGILGD